MRALCLLQALPVSAPAKSSWMLELRATTKSGQQVLIANLHAVCPDDTPVKTRLRNEEIRAALSILAAEDTRAARVLLGDFNATAEELQPL